MKRQRPNESELSRLKLMEITMGKANRSRSLKDNLAASFGWPQSTLLHLETRPLARFEVAVCLIAIAFVLYFTAPALMIGLAAAIYAFSCIQSDHLADLAFSDPLTGLPNSRALAPAFQRLSSYAQRRNQVITALFLDIDEFGMFNYAFGYAGGDRALQAVASALTASIRPMDVAIRRSHGADEFIVLIAHASDESHLPIEIAERIQASAGSLSNGRRVTLSVGVATCPPLASLDEVLQLANSAVQLAKQRRDCVVSLSNVQHQQV